MPDVSPVAGRVTVEVVPGDPVLVWRNFMLRDADTGAELIGTIRFEFAADTSDDGPLILTITEVADVDGNPIRRGVPIDYTDSGDVRTVTSPYYLAGFTLHER